MFLHDRLLRIFREQIESGERILDFYKKFRHGSMYLVPGVDVEVEGANKLGAKKTGRRDSEGLYDELFAGYGGTVQ